MRIRSLVLIFVLVAVAGFCVLNWNVFLAPSALSLGVASVQAPLGLIMLGLLIFLVAYFLILLVYMQSTALIDTRRHTRELQTNRDLADKAEVSRFTLLREFLDESLKQQTNQDAASLAVVLARLETLDRDLRMKFEEIENSLGAQIAEMDDRFYPGGSRPQSDGLP